MVLQNLHTWRSWAQQFLWISETLILCAITVAFWHHSPPIRDQWVWLLGLALPIFALRWLVYGRLATFTPLLPLFGIFLLLTMFNYANAPYKRADYWVLICRPLAGIWLCLFAAEVVRHWRRMDALLWVTIGGGAIIGILAVTASQWNDKIASLNSLVVLLPRVEWKTIFPDMLLSFNPNEIAGAIAWLCPLLAGIALYAWQKSSQPLAISSQPLAISSQHPTLSTAPSLISKGEVGYWRGMSLAALVVFALLAIGLFFGQSRFAIGSVLVTLAGLVWFGVRSMRWRWGWLVLIGLVTLAQLEMVANIIPDHADGNATFTLTDRDQQSVDVRGQMWGSTLQMLQDYPLTGIGMAMYRFAVREPRYQIPYYAERNDAPPHAHNEWLQVGADLGGIGIMIFVGWQLVTGWLLWQARNGKLRILALGVACGLLAHMGYGVGDAVTLWDRYQFLFWWLLGLSSATYLITLQDRVEPEIVTTGQILL